ncbi:hypothetical protein [Terrimonas alba]|uniref:hypothetical protein n=1 Tax=Terrimonas alba TaxID=3349636 RepID=UPI0035F3B1EF
MSPSPLDIELSKYWSLLTPAQKESLLNVIKSFIQSPERIAREQYNHELEEAEAEFQAGNYISSEEMLKLIRQW